MKTSPTQIVSKFRRNFPNSLSKFIPTVIMALSSSTVSNSVSCPCSNPGPPLPVCRSSPAQQLVQFDLLLQLFVWTHLKGSPTVTAPLDFVWALYFMPNVNTQTSTFLAYHLLGLEYFQMQVSSCFWASPVRCSCGNHWDKTNTRRSLLPIHPALHAEPCGCYCHCDLFSCWPLGCSNHTERRLNYTEKSKT